MGERAQTRRPEKVEEAWVPKTRLGELVVAGKITSLDEIFRLGLKIKEPEIVKTLLPGWKNAVVGVGIVQKQTDAGEVTRFLSVVATGDGAGWFGVGKGKARQMRTAIENGTSDSLLNIVPVRLGCGSWECRCGTTHSVPFRTEGRGGSVKVIIIPGPRGLGLVAGETVRNMLRLAGIKDAWTRTYGSTSTMPSIANAIYDGIKKMHRLTVPPT